MAGPHPVDAHVGQRLRDCRRSLGLSQTKVATVLGVTFQQVQKYERGVSVIIPVRLLAVAKLLKVPVAYFFEGMLDVTVPVRPIWRKGKSTTFGEPGRPFDREKDPQDPLHTDETRELLQAYWRIRQRRVRLSINELVNRIGQASHAETLGRKRRESAASAGDRVGGGRRLSGPASSAAPSRSPACAGGRSWPWTCRARARPRAA